LRRSTRLPSLASVTRRRLICSWGSACSARRRNPGGADRAGHHRPAAGLHRHLGQPARVTGAAAGACADPGDRRRGGDPAGKTRLVRRCATPRVVAKTVLALPGLASLSPGAVARAVRRGRRPLRGFHPARAGPGPWSQARPGGHRRPRPGRARPRANAQALIARV